VAAYIETAIRLGTLLNSCETGDALRSALSVEDGKPTMKSIAPRLGPGLTADSKPGADSVDDHTDTHAGMPAAQAIVDYRRLPY